MRIVLFDGIQEFHLITSLDRALQFRGHTTLVTGQLTDGFKFIEDRKSLHHVSQAIERAISFAPDLVIVFRPSALPPELFESFKQRIHSCGGRIAVWLSDDPVLLLATYRFAIDQYDIILHCASRRVLEFYEAEFSRPTGVNFPFWTDSVEFPLVYGTKAPESEAVFIGNVHDLIRRERYFTLSNLSPWIRIHGKTGADYFNLGAGFLHSNIEVANAGATSRLAVNIPQFFSDYKGTDLWFPELRSLGSFLIPSRLVQYAAMGVPTVSLEQNPHERIPLNGIIEARTIESLRDVIEELVSDSDRLEDISSQLRRSFEKHYTASSRAQALEHLVNGNDDWLTWNLEKRANWYMNFDGASDDDAIASQAATTHRTQLATKKAHPKRLHKLVRNRFRFIRTQSHILLIGVHQNDPLSSISVIKRGLKHQGYSVSIVSPNKLNFIKSKEPGFIGALTAQELRKNLPRNCNTVVLVGGALLPPSALELDAKGLTDLQIFAYGVEADENSVNQLRLLADRCVAVSTSNETISELYLNKPSNLEYVPDLIDSSATSALKKSTQGSDFQAIGFRQSHFQLFNNLLPELKNEYWQFTASEYHPGEADQTKAILSACKSPVKFLFPDPSRKGTGVNRILGLALAGGGIVILPAAASTPSSLVSGKNCILASNADEAHRKLYRVLLDPDWADSMSCNALVAAEVDFGFQHFLAWAKLR